MGSADRNLKDSHYKTILSILETSYTHANTNFKDSSLKSTKVAFEYLSKNPFPYEKLYSNKRTLADIIKEV